ncbi:MAG: PAS domain S-box protein [Methanobacteriaceae archaeon]|nr:PAS domain S-box protein [Methanobacteriaceae archaeon]
MKSDKTTAELQQEIERLKSKIAELEKSKEELKKVQKELEEKENYQKTIFSAIQTGIIIIDAETCNILDLNKVAMELIGASKEEIVGRNCHHYVCPAEEGRCPIIDLNQTVDNSERVLLDVDGNEIPIIKNVVPVNLNGHEVLLESFMDIRDRKKAEEALKRSEEKYRTIVEKFLKISNEIIIEINK